MTERNPFSEGPSPGSPDYLARPVDARAMKAFAHPLRMAMYDYLNDHGSATATMLARHTGESTGQTSYHLRQLERHGFVEEDTGRGTGRERWWRSVGFSMEGTELAKDSKTRPAVMATLQHQTQSRSLALAEWFARAESEPGEWQDSSTNSRTTLVMTAQEASDMSRAFLELMHEHIERVKARHPEGRPGPDDEPETDLRRVRVYLDIFPLARD